MQKAGAEYILQFVMFRRPKLCLRPVVYLWSTGTTAGLCVYWCNKVATAPRSTPCSYCRRTTRLLISNVMLNPQEHLQLCTAVDLQHTAEQAVKFLCRIMLAEGRVSSAPRCRHTCTREKTIENITPEATPSWKRKSNFPPRDGQYRLQHFLKKPHSTQNTFFLVSRLNPVTLIK